MAFFSDGPHSATALAIGRVWLVGDLYEQDFLVTANYAAERRYFGGSSGVDTVEILGRFLDAPETNVAIFAFLLNLTWELAQVPLFAGMPSAEHWQAILVCGRATLGDVVIALVSFWAVAVSAHTRSWMLRPTAAQLTGFVAVGVLITILMEWLATQVLDRWMYAEAMPVTLLLGVGLSPLLQWVVLPPIVVWFVRRHLT